ncbi:MAG: TPM domain-containing protein [Candidatus Omnitrophota bacterium]
MKRIITTILILAGYFAILQTARAEDVRALQSSGFVNDYAGILPSDSKNKIEGVLREIEKKTTAEIAVVTVKTTQPFEIEQYAVELFKRWGIGKKGKDNGILVLVAAGDRKMRIEVGYGLEGVVTDLKSKLMIQDLMTPAFKKGDYGLGITAAVVMIANLISAEYNIKLDLDSSVASLPLQSGKTSPAGSLFTLLFFLLIFGFRFGTLFFVMGPRGGGYWSGGSSGSFGGGFGGFGGGFSGGGGASGSW